MEPQEKELGWKDSLGEHANNPAIPRQTGEMVFGLGQEWIVSPWENRIKAQFEDWVQRNAKRAITKMEATEHPDNVRHYREAYIAMCGASAFVWPEDAGYDTAGKAVREALADLPGMKYLFFLCLRRCHPDIQERTANLIFAENPEGSLASIGFILKNIGAPEPKKAGAKPANPNQPATLDANDPR